jgi:uncharacterized membrane protein
MKRLAHCNLQDLLFPLNVEGDIHHQVGALWGTKLICSTSSGLECQEIQLLKAVGAIQVIPILISVCCVRECGFPFVSMLVSHTRLEHCFKIPYLR